MHAVPMKQGYPPMLQKIVDGLFQGKGVTDRALRRAVGDKAAALSLLESGEKIPADLESYVEKIALNAHQITDEDVAALKASGRSEDEIFEVTLAAAVGAGMLRLDRGLLALGKGRK